MADQDNLNLEDVGVGSEEAAAEGRKAGFLPAFVIQILKWVAIALGLILIAATAAVITVTIYNRNGGSESVDTLSPKMTAKPPVLQFEDSLEAIRGRTSDEPPAIFTLSVSLGYRKEDAKLPMELTSRKRQIQSLILVTISQKFKEDLKPANYGVLQEELKQQINGLLVDGQIQEVAFREFIVAQ